MTTIKKSKESSNMLAQAMLDEIDRLRMQLAAQGRMVWAMDQGELQQRAMADVTPGPYIYMQAWTSATQPGTIARYSVWVANPNPTAVYPLFATMFFGMGNFLEIGHAYTARDNRFPHKSSEPVLLSPYGTRQLDFEYRVPYIDEGTYIGNAVIWTGSYHDVGAHHDRGMFTLYIDSNILIDPNYPGSSPSRPTLPPMPMPM